MTTYEKFMQRHRVDDETGCWLWTAGRDSSGYAQLYGEGGMIRGHRFSYEHFVGPVPKGCHVHHKCENKACVNPQHLECLTNREHRQRHRQAVCKRGHIQTPDVAYARPDGDGRHCLICGRERRLRYDASKMRDRHARGLRNRKLTADQVVEIRQRRADEGALYSVLATEYGVNPQTISNAVNRVTWQHV